MITELVIDRTKWGTGSLLRPDGKMCCLGFLSRACGVPDELMLNNGYPAYNWIKDFNFNKEFSSRAAVLVARANAPRFTAVNINDSTVLSNEVKEAKLIKLFADNGITLSFVGEHNVQ